LIKAIFFDWFNTLARYEPPREELHSRVLHEFGIEVSPSALVPAVLAADRYFFDENALSPVEKRNSEEKAKVYIGYSDIMLTEVGAKSDKELLLKIVKREQQLFQGMKFVLFEDVLPTLKTLDERNFILGVLTNFAQDMAPLFGELGLEAYLDFAVTPQEVGADKPLPPIFLAALDRAGVNAAEAIYVGDQYKFDVVGARGVGIAPILIDRFNAYPKITDCPRISSLPEVIKYL